MLHWLRSTAPVPRADRRKSRKTRMSDITFPEYPLPGCGFGDRRLMFCQGGELGPPEEVLLNMAFSRNPCPQCNTEQRLYVFLSETHRMLEHGAAAEDVCELWDDAVQGAMEANGDKCLDTLARFGSFQFPDPNNSRHPSLTWPHRLEGLSTHQDIAIAAVVDERQRSSAEVIEQFKHLLDEDTPADGFIDIDDD